MSRLTTSLVISFLVLITSGCISYKSERGTVNHAIPQAGVLSQIELGATTTDWLLKQFGHPQAVRRPNEQTAVWQYENVASSTTRVQALPLFAVELKDVEKTVYNFEVENSYIVRYWHENAAQ